MKRLERQPCSYCTPARESVSYVFLDLYIFTLYGQQHAEIIAKDYLAGNKVHSAVSSDKFFLDIKMQKKKKKELMKKPENKRFIQESTSLYAINFRCTTSQHLVTTLFF